MTNNPLGRGLADLARPGDRKAVERITKRSEPTVTITLTHAQMDALWSMVTEGHSAFEGEDMDDDVSARMEEAFAKCAEAVRQTWKR